jgi:hypothetical protein
MSEVGNEPGLMEMVMEPQLQEPLIGAVKVMAWKHKSRELGCGTFAGCGKGYVRRELSNTAIRGDIPS